MCLDIEKTAKSQIAKKDIVVYKILKTPVSISVKDNDVFIGKIKNIKCKGVVSIKNEEIYFCTDCEALGGKICADQKGKKFSWIMDKDVSSIIVEGTERVLVSSKLVTSYRKSPVKIGKTYTSEIERIDERFHDTIEKALHSFEKKEDALDNVYSSAFARDVIAKCIIPKGSTYYKGWFGGHASYASNKLKYIEIQK